MNPGPRPIGIDLACAVTLRALGWRLSASPVPGLAGDGRWAASAAELAAVGLAAGFGGPALTGVKVGIGLDCCSLCSALGGVPGRAGSAVRCSGAAGTVWPVSGRSSAPDLAGDSLDLAGGSLDLAGALLDLAGGSPCLSGTRGASSRCFRRGGGGLRSPSTWYGDDGCPYGRRSSRCLRSAREPGTGVRLAAGPGYPVPASRSGSVLADGLASLVPV